MQTEVAQNEQGRTAKVYPFKERHWIIYVGQTRMADTSKWGAASIETPWLTNVTADQIEQFIVALQEAARIAHEWAKE